MRSARCWNSSISKMSSCTIDNYQQYVCAGVELWYLKPILFSPNSLFYSLVDNGLVGLGYLHINYIKIQFYSLINIYTNSFQFLALTMNTTSWYKAWDNKLENIQLEPKAKTLWQWWTAIPIYSKDWNAMVLCCWCPKHSNYQLDTGMLVESSLNKIGKVPEA